MMSDPITIKLKTLTPLWTGGVETGKMDCVHEAGFIGSLRWWYEVIMRGLESDVCDPTSDDPQNRCQFDTETYQAALNREKDKDKAVQAGLHNVCPVCRLFGCTGWRRRFELSIQAAPNQLKPFWLATLNKPGQLNYWWLAQIFKTTNNLVYFDDLSIHARFMRGYEQYESILKALFSAIATYGTLGARAQYGFGVFAYPEAYSLEQSFTLLNQQVMRLPKPPNLTENFYSLAKFWHLQCQIPLSDTLVKRFQSANILGDSQMFNHYKDRYLPLSFDIRYKLPVGQDKGLRQAYRLKHGKKAARQVFGTVESEDHKWGSNVFVSHLYKATEKDTDYQLRVWGFSDHALSREIQAFLQAMFPGITVTLATGETILSLTEKNL